MAIDLPQLAQQTGIIQAPQGPPDPGMSTQDLLNYLQGQSPVGPDAVQPSPIADAATQGASAATTPSLPPTTTTSVPTNIGMGSKDVLQSSGFSPGKFQQVRKAGSAMDQKIAGIEADSAAKGQQEMQPFQAAAQQSAEAMKAETNANINKINAEGQMKAMVAHMQNNFATEEARITAQEQNQAAQSKAAYVSSLNDFRAARVDPGQLWGNMTGGQRIGMLASAFVQDYLGAKGIHTSAMATFNKAVEQNIDAQLTAMKQKGEVAQGFKQLWEMQRAQSASDAEARTRVRGFMLDSAKLQVESNLAQYDSALAGAKGQAAIAAINGELAKNMFDVNKQVDANAAERTRNAITLHGDELRASMEGARIDMERKWHEDEVNRQRRAEKAAAGPNYLVDPDTNQARWQFKSEIRPEEQEKLRDKMAGVAGVSRQLTMLRELARKNEGGKFTDDVTNGTRFSDEDHRLYDETTDVLAREMAHAMGEARSEKAAEAFRKQYPIETFFTRGGVNKILAHTHMEALSQIHDELQQKTTDMVGPGPEGAARMPNEREYYDAKATYDSSGKISTTPTDTAVKLIDSPDSLDAASKSTKSNLGLMYMDKGGHEGNDADDDWTTMRVKMGGDIKGSPLRDEYLPVFQRNSPPNYAVAITALRKEAVDGSQRAVQELHKEATREPDTLSPEDKMKVLYAQFEYSRYLQDAHESRRGEGAREMTDEEFSGGIGRTPATPAMSPAQRRAYEERQRVPQEPGQDSFGMDDN